MKSMSGEAIGKEIARQPLHLLGHLQAGHALAHERLVNVEMKEAHLGVGDLGERLAVDPAQLQEGDERKARAQDRGGVAQRLEIVVAQRIQLVQRQPDARPKAIDQRGLETGLGGSIVERVLRASVRAEESLDVGVGQTPLLAGSANLVEAVSALAQPGDDARMRHGGRRPRAAAAQLGDNARVGPALESRR